MFDKIKSATSKATMLAGDLQGMAVEKLKATAQELNECLPLFSAVGYVVGTIYVELGMSPKIVLGIRKLDDVPEQAFETLAAAHADRTTFCTILGALRQASVLQGKIQFRNRYFGEIEVELGIPPAIRMVFLETQVRVSSSTPTALVTTEVLMPEPTPDGMSHADTEGLARSAELQLMPSAQAQKIGMGEPMEDVIRFRCTSCRVRYRVTAQRAGETLSCHRCETELIIPGKSTVAAP